MGAECKDSEMQHLLLKNEVVDQKIQNPVKNKICHAGYSIPEELKWHISFENGIKEVYELSYP